MADKKKFFEKVEVKKERRYIRPDRLAEFKKKGWTEGKTDYKDINVNRTSRNNLLKDRDLILVEK